MVVSKGTAYIILKDDNSVGYQSIVFIFGVLIVAHDSDILCNKYRNIDILSYMRYSVMGSILAAILDCGLVHV